MSNPLGLIQILCGPVDESISGFSAPPGTFVSAVNASIARDGTYEPRKGFDGIFMDSDISRPRKVFSFGGTLLQTTGRIVSQWTGTVWSETHGDVYFWKQVGEIGNAYLKDRAEFTRWTSEYPVEPIESVDVIASTEGPSFRVALFKAGYGASAGFDRFQWEARGIESNAIIGSGTLDIKSSTVPKLVSLGSSAYVFYQSGNDLYGARMRFLVSPTLAWAAAIRLVVEVGLWDVCSSQNATTGRIFVVCNEGTASPAGKLYRFDEALTQTHVVNHDLIDTCVCCTADVSFDRVATAYGYDDRGIVIRAGAFDHDNLTTVITPGTAYTPTKLVGPIALTMITSTRWMGWHGEYIPREYCRESPAPTWGAGYGAAPSKLRPAVVAWESNGSAPASHYSTTWHVLLTSRAWNWDSCGYVVVTYARPFVKSSEAVAMPSWVGSYIDANTWVFRWDDASNRGKAVTTLNLMSCPPDLLFGQHQVSLDYGTNAGGDSVLRVSTAICRSPYALSLPQTDRQFSVGLDVVTIECGGRERGIPYRWQDNAIFDGGTPMVWDGRTIGEAGCLLPPRICEDIAETADAGGFALGQKFSFVAVYRRVDSNGRVYNSAVSQPVQHTMAAAGYFDNLYVDTMTGTWFEEVQQPVAGTPSLYDTTNADGWWIDVYRTTNNGSTYYWCFSIPHDPSQEKMLCDYTLSGTGSNINVSDAVLATHQELYTSGNVLANYPPESCRALSVHQNRIYWVPDSAPWTIRAGKLHVAGESPTWSTLAFEVSSVAKDEIVGLGSLGQRLYVLRDNSIDVLIGLGPNDTGEGNDWQELVTIAAVGCDAQRAVLETPNGLFFGAPNGWVYGIGQDGSVAHIGKPVLESTEGRRIECASYVQNERAVLFLSGDGATCKTLVYWPSVNQWTEWVIPDGKTSPATMIPTWCSTFDGSLLVSSNMGAYLQRASSRQDPGAAVYVTMTLTTAWMSPGGVQGQATLGRVGLLSSYSSACSATLAIQYDYAATNVTSVSWDASAIASIVSGQRVQLGAIGESLQISQSFRLIYGVSCTNTSGYGIRLHGITAEVQADQGLGRIPTASMR